MSSAKDDKSLTPPADGDCGFDSDDEDVDSPQTKELEKLMERLDRLAVSVPPSVILKHLDQATTELERKARPVPPLSLSPSLPIPLAPPLLVRQSAHSAPPPNMSLHCAHPPRQAPAKLAPASAPPPPAPTPMDTK